jgi:hypothetical protein
LFREKELLNINCKKYTAMKKLLLLLSIVLMGVSCDPPQYDYTWCVKNSTGQTIQFKHPDSAVPYTAIPGKVVIMHMVTVSKKKNPVNFNEYFTSSINSHGEDVSWQILSEDEETVLKTWRYSDRNQPGQRFFNESLWKFNCLSEGSGFVVESCSWSFEILPEDIVAE